MSFKFVYVNGRPSLINTAPEKGDLGVIDVSSLMSIIDPIKLNSDAPVFAVKMEILSQVMSKMCFNKGYLGDKDNQYGEVNRIASIVLEHKDISREPMLLSVPMCKRRAEFVRDGIPHEENLKWFTPGKLLANVITRHELPSNLNKDEDLILFKHGVTTSGEIALFHVNMEEQQIEVEVIELKKWIRESLNVVSEIQHNMNPVVAEAIDHIAATLEVTDIYPIKITLRDIYKDFNCGVDISVNCSNSVVAKFRTLGVSKEIDLATKSNYDKALDIVIDHLENALIRFI